jgi:non-ribosomal peptide synthetase-like protein
VFTRHSVLLPDRPPTRLADRPPTRLDDRQPTRTRTTSHATYSGGRPARPRTLWEIFEATAARFPTDDAVDDGSTRLDYTHLRDVADRLGARLTSLGIGPGDRVGIRMPSGAAQLYVSVLGVLAAGAAYVPVDVDDPDERAELVWAQSSVCAVLGSGGELVARPVPRAGIAAGRAVPEDDAWIIFTSGTTGRPKGVAVTNRNAAAFVDAEAGLFLADDPLGPGDRVLAGLSVAFDASCEEMWLAWRHGACLVPAARAVMRTGPEVASWLVDRRVTVVSTVPTMAAMWPLEKLDGIRLMVLGGEACPAALADRLTRRFTEVWNTYGPTEGTCVSTAARLSAGQPVRIGLPLAGWDLAVVDPEDRRPVPWGGVGELVIGGVGVARYLDAEQDARAFAPVPMLGWQRAYRSGDLVRAEPEGLVYLGRADAQVKIRGYRIELTEIESVLLQVPGIAQAAVTTYRTPAGVTELAGYYSVVGDHAVAERQDVFDHLRRKLPSQMVPAYLDQIAVIPLMSSGKADRAKLPPPTGPRCLAVERAYLAPVNGTETTLAQALADVLGLERVSADSDFFADLGLSSLLVAHFCARAREVAGAPASAPSTRDVYLNPTVRRLAAALADRAPDVGTATVGTSVVRLPATVRGQPRHRRPGRCSAGRRHPGQLPSDRLLPYDLVPGELPTARLLPHEGPAADLGPGHPQWATVAFDVSPQSAVRPEATTPVGTFGMVVCGTVQLSFFLASIALFVLVANLALIWIAAARDWTAIYLRSLAFSAALLVATCVLPIAAKWVLVGRWTPTRVRVWSLGYLRFWLVRIVTHVNPMALFVGSPLYSLYLRALGARIGRRVVVLSSSMPICTDLLTIGDDTVIRRHSTFSGYRARAGMIETGAVTIGRDAFVGEHTVLDLDTRIGDGAQLGHTSTLFEGQAVPDGERWHGSPAQPTDVDYRRAPTLPCSPTRRVVHSVLQVLIPVLVVPIALAAVVVVATQPQIWLLVSGGPALLAGRAFYLTGLVASLVLFVGAILSEAVVVLTVPRLLRHFVTPGKAYPLYGLHHWVIRTIRRLTNARFLLELTGDSSYVVGYLRALGYRMPDVEQTGSNFGAALDHDSPYLIEIGRGTMVSDGASLLNADFSSTSVVVSALSVGPHNFLGTAVAFPSGGRTGENCLIATKAMVPLEGPLRENVGLLGSPCFEIPRSVTDDPRFDHLKTGEEFHRRLAAKNRHNIVTMALFLAVRWVHLTVMTWLAMAVAVLYRGEGVAAVVVLVIAMQVFSLCYFVLVERGLMRFRSLKPQYCSIYDRYFWWHERYWKLLAPHLDVFNGTPFKSVVWRWVGVKVGKRLFDDGCGIPERTLVTIGDDCTLNGGAIIQGHSMEDGIFKADHTVLGSGCTVGVGALVHYGVAMGRDSELLADAFLMKGERVPDGARWGGNPARAM